MSSVAIVGAGPVGASIAHRLAARGRVPSILVVDASANAAAGKVLDIRQSGPIERFDTPLSSDGELLAAAAAPVVVIADEVHDGPWEGDRGLSMVTKLVRAGSAATFVFACPSQTWLMEAAYRELHVPAERLVGTAPSATVAAVRAVAGLELGLSSVDLTLVGRPPALVVGWTAATAGGSLVSDLAPPHRLLAISAMLPRLWPPKPYAIASATAPIVEALISGSRRRHPALTILDGELGARGAAGLLSLELGRTRVLSHAVPSLSPQERTEMITSLAG